MYSTLRLAKKYIHYLIKSSNSKGHGVHSPFVYDFIRNVLLYKLSKKECAAIEAERTKLLRDSRMLTIQDFGAGSAIENEKKRTILSLAKNSLKSPKYAQLLYKIAKYYAPQNVLELGTCLGITTAYLSKASAPQAKITTMEGAPEVAQVAKEVFKNLSINNISIIEGNFDNTLPDFIKQLKEQNKKIDLIFIDGNHREKPTINYFRLLKSCIHDSSIIIFDDIHWSKGMEQAWEIIKNDENVTMSIDLFFIGLIFFKKEFKVKQHFSIRY